MSPYIPIPKGRGFTATFGKNTKQVNGWYLNDEMICYGKRGWIFGFTGSAAYIVDKNGDYITAPGKSYKQVSLKALKLVRHNNNWQYVIA